MPTLMLKIPIIATEPTATPIADKTVRNLRFHMLRSAIMNTSIKDM
jgi:hypothetical protein